MNSIHSASAGSSEMGDLDGYSVPGDYSYKMPPQYRAGNEDFGFDPPSSTGFPKVDSYLSPPTMTDSLQLSQWSGFGEADSKDTLLASHLSSPSANSVHSHEFGDMLNQTLPDSARAISRYGQVTPPRSNSASSEDNRKNAEASAFKTGASERRKRSSKALVKEESEPSQTTTTARKRKTSRKSAAVKEEQDDKRRQSLEKNRLAAAKCRINKKEKTEQLQRHSHEKAVHNAFLKEQVMRMKEEVQQMNALLLAHANCDGCKSPEEIQKHLSNLGNEFFTNHMSSMNYDYTQMNMDEMPPLEDDPSMQSAYYGSRNTPMLNPPLPDFDPAADFEVHTPMQTD